MRESPIPVEVDAYIEGEIDGVIPEEGVVIKTNGVFIQGIFGIGGESRGEIQSIVEGRAAEITEDMISADLKGKIIVGSPAERHKTANPSDTFYSINVVSPDLSNLKSILVLGDAKVTLQLLRLLWII